MLTLTVSAGKPYATQRLRAVARECTLIGYVDPVYKNSYGQRIEAFPPVAAKLDMKGVATWRVETPRLPSMAASSSAM